MSKEKRIIVRIIAIFIIVLGATLGVTWNRTGFCMGDRIFHALGLPAWSNGTTGSHYPAIIGSVFILVGISAINYTLQKRERYLVWMTVIAFFVVLKMVISYL